MRRYWHLLVCFLILLVCCDDSEISTPQNNIEDKILNQVFGDSNLKLPVFTLNAANFISTWPVFEDVTTEVNAINGAMLKDIKTRSIVLSTQMDSLVKMIPDTLRTQGIQSRVIVAKTRASLVQQEVAKFSLDSSAIEYAIKEMNSATSNLIIQINEKFEKDTEDNKVKDNEKMELDILRKKMDSIYKAEVRDQTN